MFSQQFIQRIFFEYRMFFLWIVVAIVGAVIFVTMYNSTRPPATGPAATPDTNVYY